MKQGDDHSTAAASSKTTNNNNPDGPWPECVGMGGEDCVRLIEANAPDLKGNVFVVPHDSMVTMDYREDRVRVWIDENGIVAKPPGRG